MTGSEAVSEKRSLYDRLGGVYSIATVVEDLIDRIMVDPRLNANPLVDEAHHKVPPAGFKYLVTEMLCWLRNTPAAAWRSPIAIWPSLSASGKRSWTTCRRRWTNSQSLLKSRLRSRLWLRAHDPHLSFLAQRGRAIRNNGQLKGGITMISLATGQNTRRSCSLRNSPPDGYERRRLAAIAAWPQGGDSGGQKSSG